MVVLLFGLEDGVLWGGEGKREGAYHLGWMGVW